MFEQDTSRDRIASSPGQTLGKTGGGNGSKKHIAVIIKTVSSTDAAPSLSTGSPTPSSSTSVDTRILDLELTKNNNVLEDDGTGILAVPQNNPQIHRHHEYACLFHTLNCHDTFSNIEKWKTHVLSHFRAHPPPPTARCPLCPDEKFTNSSPHNDDCKAWDLMLDHVATAHYQKGQTLAGSRPDFELMQYLYRLRIISDAQFKAIQLPPPPSSPAYHQSQDPVRESIGSADEPYCAPYSRRRERRLRGQRQGIGVVWSVRIHPLSIQ